MRCEILLVLSVLLGCTSSAPRVRPDKHRAAEGPRPDPGERDAHLVRATQQGRNARLLVEKTLVEVRTAANFPVDPLETEGAEASDEILRAKVLGAVGKHYTVISEAPYQLAVRTVFEVSCKNTSLMPLESECAGRVTFQVRDAEEFILFEKVHTCRGTSNVMLGNQRAVEAMTACAEKVAPRLASSATAFTELASRVRGEPSPTTAAEATPQPGDTPPAPPTRRMAVLEFRAAPGVSVGFLANLSDAARAGLLPRARQGGYLLMTRESMVSVLKDMGKCEATEGECEVETGRMLGVDCIITGEVHQIEQTWVVSMKSFDAATGALLGARKATGKSQLEVIDTVEREAAELLISP